MQCRATAKRTQLRCRKHAIRGREVCRVHGGRTPRGPASVHWKGGRYSRHLPARLAAQYEVAARDPKLTELKSDIALVDARIIDLLQRVDTGEAGIVWRQAQAAMAAFEREQARQNVDGMKLALEQVQRLMTHGAEDYAVWEEISELIEQRRKLCDSESKRLVMLQQMLTVEQAMLLLETVTAIIQRHVPDRQTLQAIAFEIQGLVHVEPRPPLRIVPALAKEQKG
jgi:hypothetical protein